MNTSKILAIDKVREAEGYDTLHQMARKYHREFLEVQCPGAADFRTFLEFTTLQRHGEEFLEAFTEFVQEYKGS